MVQLVGPNGAPLKAAPNGTPTRIEILNELKALTEYVKNNDVSNNGLGTRMSLGSGTGVAFRGKRRLWDACGYKALEQRTYRDYYEAFRGQSICKAVINAPVRASWRKPPKISDGPTKKGAKGSEFDVAWSALLRRIPVFRYISRADRLACIGRFSVVLMGTNDTAGDLKTPRSTGQSALKYVMVFSEDNAVIHERVKDKNDERFGRPLLYKLKVDDGKSTGGTTSGEQMEVHWSRCLHITTDLLESDLYSIPALEAPFNDCQNVQTILGSSAEAYWRNAFPGIAFIMDPKGERIIPGSAKEREIDEQIDEYMHDLRRELQVKGMTVQQLMSQIADPSGNLGAQLDSIAGGQRIPKRILIGSERGELASTNDSESWANVIEERQSEQCEPMVRLFVDFCIAIGELPVPRDGDYMVKWGETPMTPTDEATRASTMTQAAAAYASNPQVEAVVPLTLFRRDFLGFSPEQLEECEDADEVLKQEAEEAEEDELEGGIAVDGSPFTIEDLMKEAQRRATVPPADEDEEE